MLDTFGHLAAANILAVGGGMNAEEAYAPRFFETKGLRIAVIGQSQFGKNYTEARDTTPGIAIIDEAKLKTAVAAARDQAHIVIVSFHFGDEYEPEPNAFQKKIAETAIDAGADIVVGHHPHVLEPLKAYGRGFIVYSLGNFIFDQDFSEETMTSAILDVTVLGEKITAVRLLTVRINERLQPELVENP